MNPNAPSFGFNPAAAGFVPRFLQQQQQQQQQQEYDAYYNQGFTGFAAPPPLSAAPPMPPAPSSGPAPLPPKAAAMASESKPAGTKKAVSVSLGGAKKPEPPAAKDEPKPAKPAKEASAAPKGQAVKQQTKVEQKVAEKASVDSDKVLQDAQRATDEETLRDLFGDQEIKSHLNLVFVGHVDAGKSTMGGNLLYLTCLLYTSDAADE